MSAPVFAVTDNSDRKLDYAIPRFSFFQKHVNMCPDMPSIPTSHAPNPKMNRYLPAILAGMALVMLSAPGFAEQYPWQIPQAKVLPNGDLEWAPQPYEFEAGGEVRYIDPDNGDDDNAGTSPGAAWKHHPWDWRATGSAAQASGSITYVFKGGTIYRGQLDADESGTEEAPIRLAYDPAWGEGRPWFFGSEKLPAKWVRAATVDHPERLPEPDKVWALDLKAVEGITLDDDGVEFKQVGSDRTRRLDPTYTAVYLVSGPGEYQNLHLARSPDWQPMGKNFAMDYWHAVDSEYEREEGGKVVAKGFKDDFWAGKDLPGDYFDGGYIWMAWRHLMGTPTPSRMSDTYQRRNGPEVPFFEPEEGAIMVTKQYGHGKGGLPYFVENLPQLLDAPGEFYLDFDSGMLFLRAPDDGDPNQMHLEFATDENQIRIANQSHVEIGGLGFAFAHGNIIDIQDTVDNVNVHHCEFRNIGDIGVRASVSRSETTEHVMDRIRVADSLFTDIGSSCAEVSGRWVWNQDPYRGHLEQVDILRNRSLRTGLRQRGQKYSNVPAFAVQRFQRGQIAGNIVERCFGSGIMILGGKEGNLGAYEARNPDLPLIRILVHHNKTRDTALGVNDYGGLALWQGGPTYAWSNNIGNSPGHAPAGFLGVTRPTNLSYPLYLDGAFKQYSFNNIIWGRTTDSDDPFANTTPGYFMVFGFLNQFTNNTLFRQSKGIGGSSGNRNDIVSNVFAEIEETYIASNRIGDPSLVGGGDDAGSGLRGIPSLAYAHNFFQGSAEAGYLVREREVEKSGGALTKTIDAQTIEELAEQMKAFPLRIAGLGKEVDEPLLDVLPADEPLVDLSEDTDFHLVAGSAPVDSGSTYFIPWSLYGTVGEWNFTENHADPQTVVDYHWWMSDAHFDRAIYEQIPTYDLKLTSTSLEDFQPGPSENWVKSALLFDGNRSGRVPDAAMRGDIVISWEHRNEDMEPGEPFTLEGKKATYPGELRKTLIIDTSNLLVEALFMTKEGHTEGMIANKFDGKSGYGLGINAQGHAEFFVASNGDRHAITTPSPVNDEEWHHVIGEIDRATGRMSLYLSGEKVAETQAPLQPDASLDNQADFLVGQAANGQAGFVGMLDFLRVCRGTIADSKTSIEELYAWQMDGPFRHDYMGRPAAGDGRDAGALESH